MADLLSADEVTSALADLDGWSGDTSAISRTLTAPSFPAAIRLVVEVAEAAEDADHHPDIDIRWRTVTFTLSTHSEGGVTGKDISLARRIDELAEAHAATNP
ncbi:4a-hydroxytetrahydrobiopterin dehydratase [Planosporangium thailandense]|uniref:Putative pterin-4-alpha-carbinolamine dehydratase n=1 Tax=Planosporangium thailandense TaxID=765197 RepID=A0ABX0XU57_9ACTN|nr:4a-hydroxytetrahydrobiopterin dehydratase [Planosporangium thailandense]NJC69541.1 4a-hydroxytetrahydrobiopterin dehydratase [Planosporangium thailandense]